MANVYSIPEQALRSLPSHVPNNDRIQITNCQAPVIGPDDPTPSTFFFTQNKLLIILAIVDVIPFQSLQPDRLFYFEAFERGKSWLGFIQHRFRSSVFQYLRSLGAIDVKLTLSAYLATKKP